MKLNDREMARVLAGLRIAQGQRDPRGWTIKARYGGADVSCCIQRAE